MKINGFFRGRLIMRVIGFVSSPRKGGNSELAVKEIMRCLPEDWEKVMLRLSDLNIENCRAYYRCLPTGSKCAISDDLDQIIRNIKHSDKVIFAFPTYIYTAPGPVKKIMDRLLSVMSDRELFPGSDCVMVLPYGIEGWDGLIKEDAIALANVLHLNLLEATPIHATLPGDSVVGENLDTLHRLAGLLIDGHAGAPRPTSDALECPHCSSTALKVRPDGNVCCAICGGISHLQGTPDKGFSLHTVENDFKGHFTAESFRIHIETLTEKKALFLKNLKSIQKIQAEYAGDDLWWKDHREE